MTPENEIERVAALNRYHIFNTSAEREFDNIVKLAQTIFKVPVAHISFLDADNEFIKASVGLGERPLISRADSICALAIMQPEVTIIQDALIEPLFDGHPNVHGGMGLRFYAGAPIITPDSHIIGTMCLVDFNRRSLTEHEKAILRDLASVVMDQVELRLSNLERDDKQRTINNQLATSEERLQGILDTMAEGVCITDVEGQLVYANPMAQRILGLTESDLKERKYNDSKWKNLRIDGSPLPEDDHPMTVILKTGMAIYDQEISLQPPGGERFYISINAAPIVDDNGCITGGIGTFMDVTNRRKLLKQKDEFISIASHELKTPITSLKASLQLLDRMKHNPSPDKLDTLITQSNKSLDKLTKLVSDLLDTNRIAQGQLVLRKTTFTIASMLNDCCHHIRTAGTHELVMQGDLDLQVTADEQQIDQVMVNLVNNAVKYAPGSPQICVKVEKTDGYAKISVTDKGPGVTPDKLPHLFDRFFRADYSGIQFSGLGLGLYICAEIIKKHGGDIGVNSEPGKGCTFWFTLPL